MLVLVLPCGLYLGSKAIWQRLSPLWQTRVALSLHVYLCILLPLVLFAIWSATRGSATSFEQRCRSLGMALVYLRVWPLLALPLALLVTWRLSLSHERETHVEA
jgi:Na+/H+-dicarboxylate symporter